MARAYSVGVMLPMMKLELFLFPQLKDGTLSLGIPVPWSTSQALCVATQDQV